MRIALFTDGIWPQVIGGIQKHSYYLCKYLARNKIKVDLYYTHNGSKLSVPELFDENELQFINPHYIEFPVSTKIPGHYLRSSIEYSRRVLDAYHKNEPADLIYSQGLTGYAAVREKGQRLLPPVLVNVHGYEFLQKAATFKSALQHRLFRPAFKVINENADFVFSFGGKISGLIKQHYQIPDSRILECPIGIDEEFIRSSPVVRHEVIRFVFVGRNERRKGIQEVMQAISSLNGKVNFTMSFVGDIPPHLRLNSDKVKYHGQLTDATSIKSILQDSDVLLCPSYAEGMPNVILEGMASGCAIIASDVGAINTMVNSDNGWLISPGSVDQLRSAMAEAASMNQELLQIRKANSIKKIKDAFCWKDVISNLISIFQALPVKPQQNKAVARA